jgi:hypothetical protein
MLNRSAAAAIVMLLALPLAACGPSAPAPGNQTEGNGAVELDAAQAELDELLDSAQALLGGDWEALVSGARPCDAGGGTGAQVSTVRTGPGVAEGQQQPLADALLEVFAAAGFELTTSERSMAGSLVIEGVYPLNGKDDDGRILQFTVGTGSSSLSGHSRCVPGDPNAINLERNDPLND